MSSVVRRIDQGELEPRFEPSGSFSKEISLSEGVLKYIDLYSVGDHVTNITGAATDGETRPIQELQVLIPRKQGEPVVWNWKPRDLKFLTQQMAGTLPVNANPTATTGVHFSLIRIPLALPKHLTTNPDIWGISADDIAGKIRITGTYGAANAIGTGATVTTHRTNITTGLALAQRRKGRILPMAQPMMVMAGQENRFAIESDARHGPLVVQTGNIHKLYALFLRQQDISATAAERVDGLVTRFMLHHTDYDQLLDEFHIILKKDTQQEFGLDVADIPDGISTFRPSRMGLPREMPDLFDDQVLKLTADTTEVTPLEVTNVTPATGDALYANVMGPMFTRAGALQAQRAGVSTPGVR